jgi:hypothetical protein
MVSLSGLAMIALLNVLPVLAVDDRVNGGTADPELVCEVLLRDVAGSVALSDCQGECGVPSGAIVHDLKSCRNGADEKFPDNPMDPNHLLALATIGRWHKSADLAVAFAADGASPQPAAISLGDFPPEPFGQGLTVTATMLVLANSAAKSAAAALDPVREDIERCPAVLADAGDLPRLTLSHDVALHQGLRCGQGDGC